jgi:alkylation response protein AidB-like acyl-CoA dehydrogenase
MTIKNRDSRLIISSKAADNNIDGSWIHGESTTIPALTKLGVIEDALRKYGPILRDESAASSANGGLTEKAIQAFIDGGFAMFDLPEYLGGLGEYSYVEYERVVEEVSRYDMGAGWILHAVGSGFTGLFAAMLPEEGAHELWGEDRSAIIAGMAAPRGKAVKSENGYMVEGKFQFASGSTVATHFTGGCAVQDENGNPVLLEDGSPEFIGVVIPREKIKAQGNWDVIGLQSTSSIDYEIEPMFVHDNLVFHLNPWPERVLRGAPRHRVGLAVHGVMGQPPVSLGAARRALSEVAALSLKRKRFNGAYPILADEPLFQHDIAVLEAELNAARLAYYNFLGRLDDYATNDPGPMTPEWGDRAKQVCRYVVDVALKCVDFAYYWAGSTALRKGNVIGQLFLDVHAANLHVVMDRNAILQAGPTVIKQLAAEVDQ